MLFVLCFVNSAEISVKPKEYVYFSVPLAVKYGIRVASVVQFIVWHTQRQFEENGPGRRSAYHLCADILGDAVALGDRQVRSVLCTANDLRLIEIEYTGRGMKVWLNPKRRVRDGKKFITVGKLYEFREIRIGYFHRKLAACLSVKLADEKRSPKKQTGMRINAAILWAYINHKSKDDKYDYTFDDLGIHSKPLRGEGIRYSAARFARIFPWMKPAVIAKELDAMFKARLIHRDKQGCMSWSRTWRYFITDDDAQSITKALEQFLEI